MTDDLQRRRIMAVLSIILDGAQPHDIVDFVRQQEQADKPDPLWQASGAEPLTDEQIADLARQADQMIADAAPGKPPEVARHLAMRRSLFARCVADGQLATANRVLDGIAALEGVAMDGKTDKNDRKARLLLEIHRRHQALADAEPADGWEEEIEHGPRFEPSRWFACANDRERMTWKRTLDELAEEELVIVTKASNRRVHVSLTPAGEELVSKLAA